MQARVNDLLEANSIQDAKRILSWRTFINRWNIVIAYSSILFHTLSSFLTAFGSWMNNSTIVWIGIGANSFGILLNLYKETNGALLKTLLDDLKKIRDGDYLDEEDLLVGVEKAEAPKQENKTVD
jgi:hypothetical protein